MRRTWEAILEKVNLEGDIDYILAISPRICILARTPAPQVIFNLSTVGGR